MKCLILCAGYGEVTNDNPCALNKIEDGRLALDVLVDQINEMAQIDQIYVVTNGQNYEKFLNWNKQKNDEKIKIINDNTTSPDAKLGAIGDIKFTLNCENIDDDLLIVAGDARYDFDLKKIYEYYEEIKNPVVAVKKADNVLDLKQFGVINFDDQMKVTEMHEKIKSPIGNYMALALYFYPRTTIRMFDDYLSEGNKTTSPGYFLEYLYQNIDTYVYVVDGHYYVLK